MLNIDMLFVSVCDVCALLCMLKDVKRKFLSRAKYNSKHSSPFALSFILLLSLSFCCCCLFAISNVHQRENPHTIENHNNNNDNNSSSTLNRAISERARESGSIACNQAYKHYCSTHYTLYKSSVVERKIRSHFG